MESNLLLCCINNSSGYDSITTEAIHQVFGVFGRVLDIYVFSRSVQAKAFIKYESQASFRRALSELNNTNTHLGHVRVYPSKKTEIIRKPGDVSEDNDSEKLSPASERPSCHPLGKLAHPSLSGIDTPRSKASHNPLSSAPTQLDSSLQHSKTGALSRRLQPASAASTPRGSVPHSLSTMPRSSLYKADDILCYEPARSRVLFVENLNPEICTRLRPKFLANVFGCFGNVTAVFLNPSLEQALVEFQDEAQAESALRSLTDIVFFNSPFKLTYSDMDTLPGHLRVQPGWRLLPERPQGLSLHAGPLHPRQRAVYTATCHGRPRGGDPADPVRAGRSAP